MGIGGTDWSTNVQLYTGVGSPGGTAGGINVNSVLAHFLGRGGGLIVKDALGVLYALIVMLAWTTGVAEQPPPVTVTEYVVVIAGNTSISFVEAPVLHR
jgi:hypothetical protein